MKRFFKRSFVLIITFVLFFSMSVSVCFASETDTTSNSPDPTGWSSWTTSEKVSFVGKYGLDIICTVTGLLQGNQTGLDDLIQDTFAAKNGYGVSSYYEFLATNLGFNDDTQTWTLSDDLVDFCNTLIIDYNDRVTMTYRYPLRPEKAQADVFPSSTTYQMFVDAVQSHPDYFFVLYNYVPSANVRFYVIKDIQSVVNSDNDLIYANCNLYNSDWTNEFYGYSVTLDFNSCKWLVNKNISGYGNKAVSDFDLIFDDPDDSRDWSQTLSVSSGVLMRSDNVEYPLFQAKWVISSYNGALNCYKSEADMKKDIGSQFIGRYTDTYTGTPSQTITQSEVNNVVNNYYGGYPDSGNDGGSGSGSDDSGGGSGGGIFDDIISGIASGVGSIIKGIFSIIKELVDAIADALGSIVGSITDLMSLLNGNFTEFLSAVFPFMPSEFVTILVGSLTLCMLGIIIKIFKG